MRCCVFSGGLSGIILLSFPPKIFCTGCFADSICLAKSFRQVPEKSGGTLSRELWQEQSPFLRFCQKPASSAERFLRKKLENKIGRASCREGHELSADDD